MKSRNAREFTGRAKIMAFSPNSSVDAISGGNQEMENYFRNQVQEAFMERGVEVAVRKSKTSGKIAMAAEVPIPELADGLVSFGKTNKKIISSF